MKNFILLLSIFICLNHSYGQLTLSTVEFLNNESEITFINPISNNSDTRKVGLLTGRMGNPLPEGNVSYYSYDVAHVPEIVSCLPNFDFVDDYSTIPLQKAVYIVYNYYPAATGPGQLSDITEEVASIQAAVWHYTNGLNVNTITNNTIKNRANEIITDTDANGSSVWVTQVIRIFNDIDPDYFYIKTINDDKTEVAVNNILLSITQGSLSTSSVSTNENGISPSVEVIGTGAGIITATANMQVPKGKIFRHINNQCSKVILASPGTGIMKAILDWGALPVELASFTSTVKGRDVTLNWTTVSELNNKGFDIEKLSSTNKWLKTGFVIGKGTSNNQNNYSFTDRNLNSGKYNYRLKQIDYNGNFEYFSLSNDVNIEVPQSFYVSQNYPNPFNPSTKINYDVPYDGKVVMTIFDISGKEILSVLNAVQTAGYYTVKLDADKLSSGIYFYRIKLEGTSASSTGNNFVITKKMMVVK